MICDMCKVKKAEVSVEQVADGIVKTIYLCRTCSQRAGFGKFSENIDISITKLLGTDGKDSCENTLEAVCPQCGRGLNDIEFNHKIGCTECFLFFKSEIISLLKQKKRNLKYSGHIPEVSPIFFNKTQNVAELRQKLKKAVEMEDYENAAVFRDELKALEKSNDIKV